MYFHSDETPIYIQFDRDRPSRMQIVINKLTDCLSIGC